VLALVRMLVLALVAALGVASGAHAFSAKPALRTFSDSAREASGDLARNAAECVGKIGISVRRAHRSIPFNRFRYYDAEAGQYVAQDPIGLWGGAKAYAYTSDPLAWGDAFGLKECASRRDAFRSAKRDAGIPVQLRPTAVRRAHLTSRDGSLVLDARKQPIMTREYHYKRADGSHVVIQEHSAGHQFGEGGFGDQGPHFNVRPVENTRTGKVVGTDEHYSW